MVIFQDFLLEGVRFTLNNDLHCLNKDISHYEFFKTNNFLKNWKFVALQQKMPTVSHGYFYSF